MRVTAVFNKTPTI